MKMVALGDFMPSRIPSINPAKHPEETFELWSIPAFDAGQPEILRGSEIGSSKKCVEPGDVLLSRIVPHIRRSCVVTPNTNNRQIASGEWITFRGNAFDPDYLRHILVSDPFHSEFMQTVAGVGGSLLRARPEGIKAIKIPLPPLDEQKRIAGILDQAGALRRLRARALAKLNALGQAIFHEMFGDPLADHADNPMWTCEPLDASIKYIDYRGKTPPKAQAGIRLITAKNVKMGHINREPLEFIEEEAFDSWMTRGFPRKGDVLFTTEAPLGNVAILDFDGKFAVGQRLLTMQPDPNRITSEYLSFFLRSPRFVRKMIENSSGSTVRGIKSKLLKKISICYPSLDEQLRFGVALNSALQAKENAEVSEQQQISLYASLQHHAFRGKL